MENIQVFGYYEELMGSGARDIEVRDMRVIHDWNEFCDLYIDTDRFPFSCKFIVCDNGVAFQRVDNRWVKSTIVDLTRWLATI